MTEEKVLQIDLDKLHPSKTQPRKSFPEAEMKDLAASIATHGIIQPLLVRQAANGSSETAYEIVTGERRFRAAALNKLTTVPVIVRDLPDQEVREIQLIENLQREDLSAVEEAEGYSELLALRDDSGAALYTVEKIATAVGKHRSRIYYRLKLLRAPKAVQKALEGGAIVPEVAELIGMIPNEKQRDVAAKEILHPRFQSEPMNRREAREYIADHHMRSLADAPFEQKDPDLVEIILDETSERIGGGSCLDCPRRSGNMPDGNPKRPDVCTNVACFVLKRDAQWKRLQATAEKDGNKLLSAKESETIFNFGGGLSWDCEYVEVKKQPSRDELKSSAKKPASWQKMIQGETTCPVVFARNSDGKVFELVKRDLAIAAAEMNGFDIFSKRKPGTFAPVKASASEKAARTKAKVKLLAACAAIEALGSAIAKKGNAQPKGFWDLLLDVAIEHAGHDGCWLICKSLALDPKVKEKGHEVGFGGACKTYGHSLPSSDEKLGFIVELLVSQRLKWSTAPYGGDSHVVFKKFADLYDIDLGAINDKAAADLAGKSKSKKQAAAVATKEHEFEHVVDRKHRCKHCGAAAMETAGKITLTKEFRGKACVAAPVTKKAARSKGLGWGAARTSKKKK